MTRCSERSLTALILLSRLSAQSAAVAAAPRPAVHTVEPVSPPTSSDAASPTESAAVIAAANAPRLRKLSATAHEFTPSLMPREAPTTATADSTEATTSASRDEYLQPDDAEDEDELQAAIDQALTPPTVASTVSRALLRQVEFLMSNQNLWQDIGLAAAMKKDTTGSGWVSLDALLALKKVSVLTTDTNLLICALKASKKLVLNADSTMVKRITPLAPYHEYKDSSRTIFVDRLPPHSTVRSVKALFSRFGPVTFVLRSDHMLAAGSMVSADGHALISPHASPMLKPRSLSNAELGMSPMLSGRRMGGTPAASPSLSGISGSSLFLSPAQRNRAIAAASPMLDPEAFTAAFIQFERPQSCRKAVSHIVAFNKLLKTVSKALTPKGSPRVPMARRGSHSSGVPSLPAGAMGEAGVGSVQVGSESTPPRSRTIRILSQTTPLTSPVVAPMVPMASLTLGPAPARPAAHSPPHKQVALSGLTSPDLPPTHPTSTISPPPHGVPRHTLSPLPGASSGPLSPPDRISREQRAQSFTSPPPSQLVGGALGPSRKMSTGGDSPTFSPLASPRALATPFAEHPTPQHTPHVRFVLGADGLPELSLAGGSEMLGLTTTTPPVPPLPDSFIGLFVMPKIAYLKSLVAKSEQKKAQLEGTLNSPALTPLSALAEKPITPMSVLSAASAPVTATTSALSSHSVLSASAAVFQPSFVPLIAPAAVKPPQAQPQQQQPLLASSTSPLLVSRALKGNWRSDGSTPQFGPASTNAGPPLLADDFNFSLAASGSPTLGPTPSPQFDADGQLIPATGKQPKAKKARKSKDPSGSSPTDELKDSTPASTTTIPTPAIVPSDRPRFSLTNTKRNSLGVVPENARQVVSRFALGPVSAEAIGFTGGRGRALLGLAAASTPSLPPAGGGAPISQDR